MADRVILTIGTKKGVFVAEAAKPRRSFALGGPSSHRGFGFGRLGERVGRAEAHSGPLRSLARRALKRDRS